MTQEQIKLEADALVAEFAGHERIIDQRSYYHATHCAIIAVERSIRILNDDIQDLRYDGNELVQTLERERAILTELKSRI